MAIDRKRLIVLEEYKTVEIQCVYCELVYYFEKDWLEELTLDDNLVCPHCGTPMYIYEGDI